jgi:membrane-bound lytic murein transglycosylase A
VTPFRRLMIAQDTGSAIVGPARADLYWGAGDDAGRIAGRIRHPGRFVMLLPRELDMIEAGKHMPLPVPKPKIPEDEAKTTDTRATDTKTEDATKEEIKTDEVKPADAKPGVKKVDAKTKPGDKSKAKDMTKEQAKDQIRSAPGQAEDDAKAPKKSRRQAGPARSKPPS